MTNSDLRTPNIEFGTPKLQSSFTPQRPNQDVVADTLLELARLDPNLLVVTSDSRGSGKLVAYGKEMPNQIVEVGIAEQNLVGVAAGLASAGKNVFAVSPACFLTARALEQVKNDVAYSNNPVRLIGISAGVSYGALGSTHHSLHDYAALLAINNVDIVAPADNYETRCAIQAAARHPRPVYLRFGKNAMPALHAPETPFEIGQAIVLQAGSDVTFLASGETVAPALQAARQLAEAGVSAGVLSMHTLRPFDRAAVLAAATGSRAIITVEEHSVNGGLGSQTAALLLEAGVYPRFARVAFPDEYTMTGSQKQLFEHYGISAVGLAAKAKQLLDVRS